MYKSLGAKHIRSSKACKCRITDNWADDTLGITDYWADDTLRITDYWADDTLRITDYLADDTIRIHGKIYFLKIWLYNN